MRLQQEDFQRRQVTRREVARERDAARHDKELDRPKRKYAPMGPQGQTQNSPDAPRGRRNYKAALIIIAGILIVITIAALRR
jgi:hypothetical protein